MYARGASSRYPYQSGSRELRERRKVNSLRPSMQGAGGGGSRGGGWANMLPMRGEVVGALCGRGCSCCRL